MKSLFTFSFYAVLISVFSVAALSCKSAKVSTDSYEDDRMVSDISIPAEDLKENNSKEESSWTEKIFKNTKFKKVKTSYLTVKSSLGSPKVKKSTFIYKPSTDMAGILVHYDTSYYALYLSENERKLFISAVNSYLADFENKKLDRNLKTSTSIYASASGYEEFGITDIMLSNYSYPKISFGYEFIKGHPYFSISCKKALNKAVNQREDGVVKYSVNQGYYFTRDEAMELAEFFSDENIKSLINESEVQEEKKRFLDNY